MLARALLCTMVALSLGACSARQQPRRPETELIVARLTEPVSLDPLYLQGSDRSDFSALLFSFLTRYDSHNRIVPDVAVTVPTLANGGISRDGLHVTYHLRRDVRWQDGAPLTAADVAFTYAASTSAANALPALFLHQPIARVAACQRYTVCVTLRRPYAPILSQFFGSDAQPILPQHLLARYRSLNGISFDRAPIGSGPYRVRHWLRGDRIDLIANDTYFAGRPQIGRISIRIVPNHATILNQLRSGEIDATFFASPADIVAYRALANARVVVTRDRPSFGAIVFDLTDPVVRSVDVRRALQYALNRREIAKKATSGLYDADTGLRGLFGWAYDPNADDGRPDLARARSILTHAGWIAASNGVREKNGVRLELHLAYFGQSFAANAIVPLLVSQARSVGIQIDAKPYDVNQLYARNGPLYRHTFQLALLGLQSDTDPNPTQYLSCNQRIPAGFNFASYCNPAVDRAIADALTTYDLQARRRNYSSVQRAIVRDLPYLFLWQASEVDVVPRWLAGYVADAASGPYSSVAGWRRAR